MLRPVFVAAPRMPTANHEPPAHAPMTPAGDPDADAPSPMSPHPRRMRCAESLCACRVGPRDCQERDRRRRQLHEHRCRQEKCPRKGVTNYKSGAREMVAPWTGATAGRRSHRTIPSTHLLPFTPRRCLAARFSLFDISGPRFAADHAHTRSNISCAVLSPAHLCPRSSWRQYC